MIPYGRQSIDEGDIAAVLSVLRSDWLTQGPTVSLFEERLAAYCGARYAVVCNSGTSALHTAFAAAGLGPGDEFITTPMTFPATSNAGVWQGARPVFVDVNDDGNIDETNIEAARTEKTKAIVPVDYTGRPVNLDAIVNIAERHNLIVIEDACQALGATYRGKKIGSIADLTTFSFHPVKNITTAEGGAVLTNDERMYKFMKRFVTHGVTKEDLQEESPGAWYFEQQLLGLNYRLTDMQAALGVHQLHKLDAFIEKRRTLVLRYRELFSAVEGIRLPREDGVGLQSAWHLFVIEFTGTHATRRAEIFAFLREHNIGVQVHHIPVHYHPFYARLGYQRGSLPNAERLYESILSLPLFPDLSFADQETVVAEVKEALAAVKEVF